MSKKLVICSHNLKSNALKELANELSIQLGYKVYRVKPDRTKGRRSVMFHKGINKVEQFQAFQREGVSSPVPAYSLAEAKQLTSKKIVVRELTTSSQGRGITICNLDELNIEAPLYTEYIPKKKEFRVHVWDSNVIHVQEKRKVTGAVLTNSQVRNILNGYVFCTENVIVPIDMYTVATAAVKAIGRTQGAVDIVWNEKQNKCFALEVNSMPGMQGKTLKLYAKAILEQAV